MKRLLGLLMACIFLISVKGEVFAATDLEGHYARAHMEHWISMGYISGYPDSTIRPDNNISRVEFYSVVNRAFGYYQLAPVNFSDVQAGDWFYQDISKAIAAGYITLDAEAKPNQQITREEVAVIVAHVTNLTPYDPGADLFSDVNGSWRRPYIGAVAAAGIMRGYGDGTFRPFASITRAEAVVSLSATLNRTKGIDLAYVPPIESKLTPITTNSNMAYNPLASTSGTTQSSSAPVESGFGNYALTITTSTYGSSRDGDDVSGNVLVDSNNCSIKNIDINGDLVLSSNVKGTVTLTNVYVSGNIYIFGNPSITLENSEARELVINSAKNDTRVTLKRLSDITVVRLYSGASLTESGISGLYSGFLDVILESGMPANSKVTLSGGFGNVDVYSERTSFALTGGSIDTLMIDQTAERGTYNIASGSVVDYVDVSGKNSSFTGSGRIKTADVRERGVSFNRRPETLFGEYGNYSNNSNNYWDYGNGEYMLDIYVTDSRGYPVEGARLSIYRDNSSSAHVSGSTDYNGIFYAWLSSGDYTIVVKQSGYADETYSLRMYNRDEDVAIKLGSAVVNVDIVTHEYSGSNAVLLRDVRVSLKTTSGTVISSAMSSGAGVVNFNNVAVGSYVIAFEKDGYITKSMSIDITRGDRDISHHVTMEKAVILGGSVNTP